MRFLFTTAADAIYVWSPFIHVTAPDSVSVHDILADERAKGHQVRLCPRRLCINHQVFPQIYLLKSSSITFDVFIQLPEIVEFLSLF